MRDWVKFLAAFALAALLLWWVFRGVDPAELGQALSRVSFPTLLLAGLVNLAHNVFRIWRWQALLAPIREDVSFRTAFSATIVGYATSWVLPARLGEIVRPALLASREKMPVGPVLGTIVADRLMDATALIALFAVGAAFAPLPAEAVEHAGIIRGSAWSMLGVTALILVVLVAIEVRRQSLAGWVERRHRLLRWGGRVVLQLADGVAALRRPRLAIKVVLHSLAGWFTIGIGTWLGIRAVGAPLPFLAVFVVLPMLALGIAVPTPGGAGSYHGAMKVGLMLFGISEIDALSAGLMMHAMIVLPTLLVAALVVPLERWSWKDVIGAARQFRRLGEKEGLPS